MAIEQFAECYAERVGTTVDAIIDDMVSFGETNIRAVIAWWRGLSEKQQKLVTKVAEAAAGVLEKILTRAVGVAAATLLIGFLGGASWALLILSFMDCESLL
ncbi:MAG TPA: hypothetical protein VFT47_18255 [Vicinamibacterales bacterium]|nr:hypothetical protein [Vicinamibacterales bacterium]